LPIKFAGLWKINNNSNNNNNYYYYYYYYYDDDYHDALTTMLRLCLFCYYFINLFFRQSFWDSRLGRNPELAQRRTFALRIAGAIFLQAGCLSCHPIRSVLATKM